MKISDKLWGQLMALKSSSGEISEVSAYTRASGFQNIAPQDYNTSDYLISTKPLVLNSWNETVILNDQLFLYNRIDDADLFEVLRNYWPIIVLSKISTDASPFVLVHMAQSLDGKVCTISGHSKWIGNEENLTHAHRLRACVDGILVGGNTLANDLPRLDVRHVPGDNPVRLFLTSQFLHFDRLPKVEDVKTYLLSNSITSKESNNKVIDEVIEFEHLPDLLQSLKDRGINSILLEGGTETVSSFWAGGHVDWMQLHIAPIVLGSGKSCVSLSKIRSIDDGYKLDNSFYSKMGNGMMVTGQPQFIEERNMVAKKRAQLERI